MTITLWTFSDACPSPNLNLVMPWMHGGVVCLEPWGFGGRACRDHAVRGWFFVAGVGRRHVLRGSSPSAPASRTGLASWRPFAGLLQRSLRLRSSDAGGRACRDHLVRDRSSWLVWAADPFSRVFSADPGVKDGLRPPASPAASRSLTPGPVEKRFGWLSGRRPGCGAADSCLGQVRLMGREGGPSGHLPSTDARSFAHRENNG